MFIKREDLNYAPNYCEENIWFLCQQSALENSEKLVIIISNEYCRCRLWMQRSAKHPEKAIWWDYHVILLEKREDWMIWDLDTLCDFPEKAIPYLKMTFHNGLDADSQYMPLFKLISSKDYVEKFSSNRGHMRTPDKNWIAPPPPWPAILKDNTSTFYEITHVEKNKMDNVYTLENLFFKLIGN